MIYDDDEESTRDYLIKTDENMEERKILARAVSRYIKFLADKRGCSYEDTRGHLFTVALDTFNHCYSPGCSGAKIWFRVGEAND